jgi:hypothetical protein
MTMPIIGLLLVAVVIIISGKSWMDKKKGKK